MNDSEFHRRLRATFEAEAAEHLRALSGAASALEAAADTKEHQALVERIFRETHTLKGAARMVGETDAEALCHALEQQLSGWKSSGQKVASPLIAGLQSEIAGIARSLRLPVETPPPAGPAAAPGAPRTTDATFAAAGGLRVPAARLDTLLMRAEEMMSVKLTGDQHAARLRRLSERGMGWKKELERVRPDLVTLRRLVDTDGASPITKELAALLHYLDWNHEFLRELHGDVAKLAQSAGADQRRLETALDQFLEETKEVLMQPFSSLLESFPGFVRGLAPQQGKEIELVIEGEQTEIDRRVLEEMRDALLHLVRNSVDHGIEPAAERRARGKPEPGRLSIAVQSRSGGNVEITVADDGRGIDPKEVNASARRLGVIARDAPELPDDVALGLLFRSGFSTRAEATSLSGRGLGLAIVREKAEQIGGSASIESEPGRGTTIRIQVPLTLARFRGLFVSVQKQTFVIPAPHVSRVIRRREAELRRVKDQDVVTLDGATLVVLSLAGILGLAAIPRKNGDRGTAFIVVIESGRARVGLRVDDVPYEHEVVMKSLGRMLRGAHQYIGATVIGGGRIVPILNVGNLVSALAPPGGRSSAPSPAPAPAEGRKRTILVVEDSITARSLLKGILQAAGHQVRTAVDGADALTTLKFEPIDLVLTDVQMPRMDGFELTAKIRRDPSLSNLPVILITSLASRDDKARGVDAGANAYIVKSSFEQSDLLDAIGRLLP